MLVSGEASVEHGGSREASAPGVGVAKVAPGIETQPLFHNTIAIGNCGPRTKVVLEDVVYCARVILGLHCRKQARGAAEIGDPSRSGCVAHGFRHILAVADIALGADSAANVLFHTDTLAVVAIGVADAVVALLDLVGFVEAGVSYSWFHTSISHISI